MSVLPNFKRGDDIRLTITVTTAAGAAQDLTGCTLYMTGKTSLNDADAAAIFQISSGALGGIVVDSPATLGTAVATIPKASTASLTRRTVVYYDVQLKDATGKISTPDSGSFIVDLDATVTTA